MSAATAPLLTSAIIGLTVASPAVVRGVAALLALAGLVALLAWGWRALDGRAAIARAAAAAWRWIAARPAVRAYGVRHPRAWAFLARRVAPAGAFGLHFTLGLLVSALALGAFAKVADDVLERDDLARVDAVLAGFAAAHRTATAVQACRAASAVGAPATVVALGAVVAVVLLVRRRRWLAGAWVATLAGGGLLDRILKAGFHRPRPAGATAFLHHDSWSFPSGHTMGATVCYGMLAFLALQSARRRGWSTAARAGLVATAALVVLLVGASRVCLGVHYATDVIGALAAGAMWLAACVSGVGAGRWSARARASATHDDTDARGRPAAAGPVG